MEQFWSEVLETDRRRAALEAILETEARVLSASELAGAVAEGYDVTNLDANRTLECLEKFAVVSRPPKFRAAHQGWLAVVRPVREWLRGIHLEFPQPPGTRRSRAVVEYVDRRLAAGDEPDPLEAVLAGTVAGFASYEAIDVRLDQLGAPDFRDDPGRAGFPFADALAEDVAWETDEYVVDARIDAERLAVDSEPALEWTLKERLAGIHAGGLYGEWTDRLDAGGEPADPGALHRRVIDDLLSTADADDGDAWQQVLDFEVALDPGAGTARLSSYHRELS